MTIQQVLNSIHDRHILSDFIFYPLNMVRLMQLLVNEHTKEFCNIHSFNIISTIYANCESIVYLFTT